LSQVDRLTVTQEPVRAQCIGVTAPAGSPEQLVAFVAGMEALGYDEVWISGGPRSEASFATTAAALASSDRIAIGLGPIPADAHNPVIAAMEIATLARLHPGRLTVALGADPRVRDPAAPDPDPALREVITTLRMLLAGEVVNGQGAYVRVACAQLRNAPDEPPAIAMSAIGRRGLGLAARRADAVVVAQGCGPEFIAAALGGIKHRQPPSGRVTVIAHARLEAGEDEGASGPGRDAIAGSPDERAESVDRFFSAGADRLILSTVSGEADAYQRFADEVMPLVAQLRPRAPAQSVHG
jgi:alkanesulfonate monooxygenase SsuD/methylene tetrahydromethanopterin reductase-like flavin-dependent oxidoreductase (luciferase family)